MFLNSTISHIGITTLSENWTQTPNLDLRKSEQPKKWTS